MSPLEASRGSHYAAGWLTPICAAAMLLLTTVALGDDNPASSVSGEQAPGTQEATPLRWNSSEFDDDRFVARGQVTYIWSKKFGFDVPYTGPQSLLPNAETSYTLSATAFLGASLWSGAELYADPEAFSARPLSNLFGLAAIQNGELQKASGTAVRVYAARLFLRQTFLLGGESFGVPAGLNQLATNYTRRRLVFTVGKVSLLDLFEKSAYATDPRTEFMNWVLMTYGAYDFAADARGYDIGITGELYWDNWALRAGRYMEPIVANGRSLYYNLFRYHGDQVELQHDHELVGQVGTVRILVFRNHADAGEYRDAIDASELTGEIPDVTSVRRPSTKTGYGISVEQSISSNFALWARAMYADDLVEEYAFTEVDNSISGGVQIKGETWHRPTDVVAVGVSSDGLNQDHRDYLAARGLGGFLGDGRLNYGREAVAEAYYTLLLHRGTYMTLDYQRIQNPGYNFDRRGPVNILSARLHAEF